MKRFLLLFVSVFLLAQLSASTTSADDLKDGQDSDVSENTADADDTNEQIAALKAALEDVKKIANAAKEDVAKQEAITNELKEQLAQKAAAEEASKDDQKAEPKEAKKPPVAFKPYGFLEITGWGNDSGFVGNDLVIYVKDIDKSTVGASAKKSRLGTKILFPSIESVDLMGVLEVDFFANNAASGAAETRPMLRLRHAYSQLSKSFDSGTTIGIKAGQTWATAIPLVFPSLINPGAGWGMGNIWQRMPLAELFLKQKAGKTLLTVQLGASRAMTGASSYKNAFVETAIDAGDAALMPMLQGQVSLGGTFTHLSFNVGVGGAFGKEDYTNGVNYNSAGTPYYGEEINAYLFNAGGFVKHKYAGLSGKFYTGKNLDAFGVFGGALETTIIDENIHVVDGIKATGYWGQLAVTPFKGLSVNGGLGAELIDVDSMAEGNVGAAYKKNASIWVSAFYTMFDHYTVGLQWLNLTTTKVDGAALKGNSIMGSIKLGF